ncbi:MAG: hypothetical protein A2103_00360 [Gammaproteobacteria bacterium GWF2_41_13]|nr:MAG: hypothetical protein A2103_00360 [Gammaproteobacteria bacterium GWF2_41_13]
MSDEAIQLRFWIASAIPRNDDILLMSLVMIGELLRRCFAMTEKQECVCCMMYAQLKLMLSKARNSCNMKPEFWIRS